MVRLNLNQQNVQIRGPFWTASVRVIQLEEPHSHWGLRTIFVDQTPRTAFDQAQLLLPGVLLIAVEVNSVRIHPSRNARFDWQKTSIGRRATQFSLNQLKEDLKTGSLAILLVNANPDDWQNQTTQSPLPAFDCLGGHIRLDVMQARQGSGETDEERLYQMLGLEKAARPEGTPYYLHPSGLTLYGQRVLPWQTTPVKAPFRLLREFADGQALPLYRLDVDEPLLTSEERKILVNSWQAWHQMINPGFPGQAKLPQETAKVESVNHPVWTSLEIVNPTDIPRLYWPISNWTSLQPVKQIIFHPEAFNLLLSDTNPYDPELPPTTVTRIILDELVLDGQDNQLKLRVNSTSSNTVGSGQWRYIAEPIAESWKESVVIEAIDFWLPSTQVANHLRNVNEQPVPEWVADSSPVTSPHLWGTLAIDGGWLQFPFLNLTQQMYVEAEVAQLDVISNAGTNVMRGALALGNQQARDNQLVNEEQPWNIVLTNYANLTGQWNIDLASESLLGIEMTLISPRLDLNGFLWLSAEAPTLEDSLPTLSDWPRALISVSLSSAPNKERTFPSPVKAHLSELTLLRQDGSLTEEVPLPSIEETEEGDDGDTNTETLAKAVDAATLAMAEATLGGSQSITVSKGSIQWAKLGKWSLTIQTQTSVFEQFVTAGLFVADAYLQMAPLLWLGHPTLPVIQALSLTENQLTPHFPSSNRALSPFQPKASDGWALGSSGENGAAHWPQFQGDVQVATEWENTSDLPVVFLSMPGLVATPKQGDRLQDPQTQLALAWRHDIPLTDQIYALAELPNDKAIETAVSTSLEQPPTPRQPLQRETFGSHWQEISEKASLARLDQDQVDLLANVETQITGLVEPYVWPVVINVDTTQYPGKMHLQTNQTTDSPPMTLTTNSMLHGFSGGFQLVDGELTFVPPDQDADISLFNLTAGSMASYKENGRVRDQRGWWRSGTRKESEALQTTVSLAGETDSWQLTTLHSSIALEIDGESQWSFWFKALPFLNDKFNREQIKTSFNEDNNDPEARSRRFDMLNGYEWRLGMQDAPTASLSLFGCYFFPLTLEIVELTEHQVQYCEVKGRLQLPLHNHQTELETGQTVVRLQFERQVDGSMLLMGLHPISDRVAWPLRIEDSEPFNAPYLSWESATVETMESGRFLTLKELFLQVYLFDYLWQIPIEGNLQLPGIPITVSYSGDVPSPSLPSPLRAETLSIDLDMATYQHQCHLLFSLVVGGVGKNGLDLEVAYNLLLLTNNTNAAPTSIRSCYFFEDIFISNANIAGNEQTWEVSWLDDGLAAPIDSSVVSLLPGMRADITRLPGFAIFSFEVDKHSSLVTENIAIPRLQLTVGFLELLLTCQWGSFLQREAAATFLIESIFKSSAGDLHLGYTASWTVGNRWEETYLLNGMLEISNLISWPSASMLSPSEDRITIPAWQSGQSLDHTRHTIRLLFNQHKIPLEVIQTEAGGTILDLASGKSWQFLAVVEHQLLDVKLSSDLTQLSVDNDRRFATVQEVRLLSADTFMNNLEREGSVIGDNGQLTSLSETGSYFQASFAAALKVQMQRATHVEGFLFVEASAPLWVRQTPIASEGKGAEPSTPLQFLPTGSQLALLSQSEDYTEVTTDDEWLLLVIPFLGRLQSQLEDGVSSGSIDSLTPIQQDPLLFLSQSVEETEASHLAAQLASRSLADPVEIPISPLDLASLRSLARLDITTLEENWFRLRHPQKESIPPTVQSIMAALPDTPARLSRSNALRQLHDSMRTAYPPHFASSLLPLDQSSAELVWCQGHLLLFQGSASINTPYAWHLTAALLHSSHQLRSGQTNKRDRFPAATLLPVNSEREGKQNPLPVSFAVSPYTGLAFRPAPIKQKLHMISIELLCLDTQNQLKPVTSLLRTIEKGVNKPFQLETYVQFARKWGLEMHKRLTPEAPIAVLRLRKILQNESVIEGTTISNQEALLVTAYEFHILSDLERPPGLPKRAFKLRVPVDELAFQEGQFGGSQLPKDAASFELAPPQTTAVQPIHLETRPVAEPAWPWGYRGLLVSQRHTVASRGITGRAPDEQAGPDTLWWFAPQHQIQFRSGLESASPVAGLPPRFRARAITSFLPALPNPPMPKIDNSKLHAWQAILPGGLNYLLKGNRAGAFLTIRNQLIRQHLSSEENGKPNEPALVSGSLSVHHRVPRPVSLPSNFVGKENIALQTWASYFEPTETLQATPSPLDEAFWFGCGHGPTLRLQVTMETPIHGEISENWNGAFKFSWRAEWSPVDITVPSPEEWAIKIRLSQFPNAIWNTKWVHDAEDESLSAEITASRKTRTGTLRIELVSQSVDDADFDSSQPPDPVPQDVVATLRRSDLTLFIDLRYDGKQMNLFQQSLAFPLKLTGKAGIELPLTPHFIYFEDPEYNRLLSSSVGKTLLSVQETNYVNNNESEQVNYAVILATDRREYNPEGQIGFRYDWDDDKIAVPGDSSQKRLARLELFVLDPETGDERLLHHIVEADGKIGEAAMLIPGALYFLSLHELFEPSADSNSKTAVSLEAGQKLRMRLWLNVNGVNLYDDKNNRIEFPVPLTHTVDIVSDPVTPSPEAGYALLRREQGEPTVVNCARFAWSPPASRIELICADDLRQDVARRRALFHWIDVTRSGKDAQYAIQKIAKNGSTHFPF